METSFSDRDLYDLYHVFRDLSFDSFVLTAEVLLELVIIYFSNVKWGSMNLGVFNRVNYNVKVKCMSY
jgi:hypothetical protein